MKKGVNCLYLILTLFFISCDVVYIATGTVVDMDTKEPLEGATIRNSNKTPYFSAKTDSNGNFRDMFIAGPSRPKVAVLVEKEGYDTTYIPDVFSCGAFIGLVKKPVSLYTVYPIAAKMPEFVGGEVELLNYLSNAFNYPEQEEIQLTFKATCVIDTLGNVVNSLITKPEYNDRLTPAEQEYLRVINEMPAWVPGEEQGKKVNVLINLLFKVDLKSR